MDLRESIIRTVCYFDLFDFPLTREEAGEWLFGEGAKISSDDLKKEIDALVARGILKEEGGYVCLSDRSGLAQIRNERKGFSARKWRRARRWANFFSALPGVELVGVGNTLAYDNAKNGSDIDFFIVTLPGKIWRTRFLCAAAAALFNLRPTKNDSRDKLCLSFFVTAEAVDMSRFAAGDEDVYLRYWARLMTPLRGRAEAAAAWRAKNNEVAPRGKTGVSAVWRALLFPLALLPGTFMRDWQKRHFPKDIVDAEARRDNSVVISDDVLKFHVGDRRADIYDRWIKRVKSMMHEYR